MTMNVLVTGSAGHLGEALMRQLPKSGHRPVGLDIRPSPFTDHVGSIADRPLLREAMTDVDAVIHTATLHKPHIVTHSRQDFIDVNVTGTLRLLEEAVTTGVRRFVFTSTTSTFGDALRPAKGAPAAWITEEVQPRPKNIYGITKITGEDLCSLFHRDHGLNAVVLRTSRFFPEDDDAKGIRDHYASDNAKANELLYRRADIEDIVDAHRLAMEQAASIGFDRLIVSATTPFTEDDLAELHRHAASVVRRRCPHYEAAYRRRGWKMFPTIDRVYVNARARERLGWHPRYDFDAIVERLHTDRPITSPLASEVGAKGYHDQVFEDGPYPVS